MGGRSYQSIGEVLALLRVEFSDLTISKIRFLESQGLLDPERTPSGYRKFYEQDVERLRWILRQQREQYLPLKVIKGRLAGPDADADGGADPPAGPMAEPPDPPEPSEAAAAPAPAPARAPAPAPAQRSPSRPAPTDGVSDPLSVGGPEVSLTLDELAAAAHISTDDVTDLRRFGLLTGRAVGGTVYFDQEALAVADVAAAFMRFGVGARHLRMYKTAAEREAGVFEQLVLPMVKQRNPQARRQALDTLVELAKLGQSLRAAMLRQALKDHTDS